MKIRKMKKEEVSTVTEECWMDLTKGHYNYDPKYYKLDPDKVIKARWKKWITSYVRKRNKLLLIAEENKEIVGYVVADIKPRPPIYKEKKEGYVSDIYVKPTHRKKGIGTKLLKECFKWFKSRKLKVYSLQVEVQNKTAIKAYEKNGFKPRMITMIKHG